MLTVIAFGQNLASTAIQRDDVRRTLDGLEASLAERGLAWSDIDLLWVSNSKEIVGATNAETHDNQIASEEAITSALAELAREREWFPPLIGSTVRASFFASGGATEDDISDGLLWVAFAGASMSPVSVGVEVSASTDTRAHAGSTALLTALAAAEARAAAGSPLVDLDVDELARGSLGLVLTSGSGHVAGTTEIDFKECYVVGQTLKQEADERGVILSGGCASNRSPGQSQTIYFSRGEGDATTYHYTFEHAAVVALLPSTQALLHLEHPYHKMSEDRLNLDFHPHEMLGPGRFFCVRSINGEPPSDFLRSHGWQISDDELASMIADHTPIPTTPETHTVSIASAPPDVEASLWPNVPVWFEQVDDDVLLRLVRAEAEDSDFFLVGMEADDLVVNARTLATASERHADISSNLVAFLCESRKYVLAKDGRNDEAELLVGAAGDNTVVGIYLNGEYSTGDFRSIGYHNYSQIGVILVDEDAD